MSESAGKWWIVGATSCMGAMLALDITGVAVALPVIQRELSLSQSATQWIMNAFLLALASTVAVAGRLADMLGKARVFTAGLGLFVASSIALGVADGEAGIIAARVAQGLGAALVLPTAAALLVDAFPPGECGRAIGAYFGVSLIFQAGGPMLGGLLTETLSWRAVFWINVPIGLAAVMMMRAAKHRDAPQRGARLDTPGAVLFVASLVAIVVGVMETQKSGWESAVPLALLGAGAVGFAAFALVERSAAAPVVPMSLFRNSRFVLSAGVLFLVMFAIDAVLVFLVIWFQRVLAMSPFQAGLAQLPIVVMLAGLSHYAGRIYDRVGARVPLRVGAVLSLAGLCSLAILLPAQSYWLLVPGMLVTGVGMALVLIPGQTEALACAPERLRGAASGVLVALMQTGGTIGLAVAGSVSAGVEAARLGEASRSIGTSQMPAGELLERLEAALNGDESALASLPAAAHEALRVAMSAGIATGFLVASGATLGACLLALALPRRAPLGDSAPPPSRPTVL